jgi:hypothetical protein
MISQQIRGEAGKLMPGFWLLAEKTKTLPLISLMTLIKQMPQDERPRVKSQKAIAIYIVMR